MRRTVRSAAAQHSHRIGPRKPKGARIGRLRGGDSSQRPLKANTIIAFGPAEMHSRVSKKSNRRPSDASSSAASSPDDAAKESHTLHGAVPEPEEPSSTSSEIPPPLEPASETKKAAGVGGSTSSIKPLDSYVDVEKLRALPAKEIEAIWRLRHASNPGSVCAVVPYEVYQRIAAAARQNPQFILPLPRTKTEEEPTGNEGETQTSPLQAVNDLLDEVCQATGNNVCLAALDFESSTTENGSTNTFTALDANIAEQAHLRHMRHEHVRAQPFSPRTLRYSRPRKLTIRVPRARDRATCRPSSSPGPSRPRLSRRPLCQRAAERRTRAWWRARWRGGRSRMWSGCGAGSGRPPGEGSVW